MINVKTRQILAVCLVLCIQYYQLSRNNNGNGNVKYQEDAKLTKLIHESLYKKAKKYNTNNNTSNKKLPKVLIYITTHMPQKHKEHFQYCWPLALKNSKLLNSSDIKIFMTPKIKEVNECINIINTTFNGMNLTYHIQHNRAYHRGAVVAISEAAYNGWFDGYDWVFRLNPDVIIQDDTWILDTILNDIEASLLYIDCHPHLPPRFGNVRKIHTDFFGLKLSSLQDKSPLLTSRGDAEELFTAQMIPIIEKGQHRHIPDTFPLMPVFCRANGNPDGPVFHFQDEHGWVGDIKNGICPASFNNLDEYDNWL